MNENVFSQPWMSWFTLGQAFWRSTRIPSRTGSVHERTFGIPSTCIRQFGHAPVMQNSPRARWYLNERAVIATPDGRERRTDRVSFERADPASVEGER